MEEYYVKLEPYTKEMCICESPQPVTEVDTIKNIGDTRDINRFGLMGDIPFMTSENFEIRKELEDKVRSYIELNVPVINTLIIGASNNIARQILGLTQKELEDIMTGQMIYDTYNGKYVLTKEAESEQSYLFCGEIIKNIIDNYNIEENIQKELKNIILNRFYTKKEAKENPIDIVKEENGNILPDYKLYVYECFNKDYTVFDMINWFKYDYIKNHAVSKITTLLRLTYESLDSLVMDTIRVIPRGQRPIIDGRNDSLNVLYSNVLRADSALRKIKRAEQPILYALKYKNLQISVDALISYTEIQRESSNRYQTKNNQRKSLFERISSKSGQARAMLKKIQNGSGRSVIVAGPDLSVDEVGIPEEMLKVSMEYHTKVKQGKEIDLRTVCEAVPAIMNRPPTLHRLSLRGYKIKPIKGNAIKMQTLSGSGYNFDFDGDTMSEQTPYNEEAIEEVNELLGVLKNLYIPASGKVTLVPKQELVYGLNIISSSYEKASNRKISHIIDEKHLIEVFEMYEVSVYDKVLYRGITKTLGEHLIDYIFTEDIVPMCKNIEKSNITEIMEKLCAKDENIFKTHVDRLVKCAYIAATIYPPCITILKNYSNRVSIDNPFNGFEENMSIYRNNYHSGYDNSETYNSIYTKEFDKVAAYVNDNIIEDMGIDNGFVQLILCGARGDKGNLQQMVSYKGRIAKSATEAFNFVITSSYLSSLNSLDQFIAAYGSRKSLTDKVRMPAKTGYMSRRLIHTAANASIVSDDCHTLEGIEISANKLMKYSAPRAITNETIEKMIAYILEGRYEVQNSDNIITRKVAEQKAHELMEDKTKSIFIRSPLTCKDKYCSKCYGTDLTINRCAIVGLPIGIIAAQSIGEPSTQLSMRTFHKGGVSSKADITSDFDKINSIINMVNITTEDEQYDPVAWADGKTYVKDKGNSFEISIENSDKLVTLKNKPLLKRYVKKGETMSLLLGNCNIKELEEYGGIMTALEHIIFSIFTIYFQQSIVNLKHIEIVASEMIKYIIVGRKSKTGLPIGMILNSREYTNLKNNLENYEIVPKLFNSIHAPLVGENFLSGMAFSYFKDVYSLAMLMGKTDNLKNTFSRILMGLPPLMGTSQPNFLKERKELYKSKIEIY